VFFCIYDRKLAQHRGRGGSRISGTGLGSIRGDFTWMIPQLNFDCIELHFCTEEKNLCTSFTYKIQKAKYRYEMKDEM
jgi:hypothetical protein